MSTPLKVILLGPMGAGKSTLGRLLSDATGWPYIDNDGDMATQTGMSIEQLSSLSIPELHKIEADFIKRAIATEAPFIAGAAASVIENEEIRELLRGVFAIYLSIPVETAIARISEGTVGRQALDSDGERIVRERYERRDPLYREISSLIIELTDSPTRDAERIVTALSAK